MKEDFRIRIAVWVLFICCLIPLYTNAQSGVNSPYSRYGVGVLSEQSSGVAKAMGGIGAGFRQDNTINLKNPASYSTVDTLTFIADLGLALQNGNFSEYDVKVNARNAYFTHIAVQYRILPKVGMTLGVMPFSNVGYSFSSTETIRRDEDGVITSPNTFSGTGGLRQFMGGFGWRPTDWLSAGVNVSYLTGDINHYVYNRYSSSDVQSRTLIYSADMAGLKLDFGLQGTIRLGENTLVLGATFAPALKLESSETYKADIHSFGDSLEIDDAFSLPELLSAGFTYKWKNRMIGADVSYQTWSKASFFGEKNGLDRLSASMGFMIRPDESSKNLFKRSSYQLGLNYSQPYFKVGDNKGPMQLGVSAGISFPINTAYNSMSYLHISGEYVRVEPMAKGMITENYLRINIGVTFMERWFMKLMVD